MIKRSLILSFVFVCTFFALQASAQIQNGDIVLEINPTHPKANQEVKASLSSYSLDLNSSKISWNLDGKNSTVGIGKKDFSFNTGKAGTSVSLEAIIETSKGSVISKQINITPTDVDLLWQAVDVYVPPFYRGKALPPNETLFKVVAIPNTTNFLGFSYKWKEGDSNKTDSSGYGKNSYTFKNSYLDDGNVVEVTVSDLLGNDVGSGAINLTTGDPKIVFYKKDLSLGTRWEEALSDYYSIPKNGEIFVAEPYFFSSKDLNSDKLTMDWFINGEKIQNPELKNTLALKPEDGQTGSATIKVSVKNITTFFQELEKTLNVNL